MRVLYLLLLISCGCTAVSREVAPAVSAAEVPFELPLEATRALAEKLTYSAVYVRAIGGNLRHFVRDVRFEKSTFSFTAYEISESLGGSSLRRTEWLVPYSELRSAEFEVRGEDSVRNRYGELRINSKAKDVFRHITELSDASVPLGPGPHLKLTRDEGAQSQLSLMFFSKGRAEDFRDTLIAALAIQTPNKAPEPTPVAVMPRATEGASK